jgi:hypothetical protein
MLSLVVRKKTRGFKRLRHPEDGCEYNRNILLMSSLEYKYTSTQCIRWLSVHVTVTDVSNDRSAAILRTGQSKIALGLLGL